jgi:hypothetical protein
VIAEKHIHVFRACPTEELQTDLGGPRRQRRMSLIPPTGFVSSAARRQARGAAPVGG